MPAQKNTVLLCHRVEAPTNLILSHAVTSFIVAPHDHHKNLEYSTQLPQIVVPLMGVDDCTHPPIKRLWISLTPSSDIKIINNPINACVKTKAYIIKATIAYIQSIYTHDLQLQTLQESLNIL
jgi:hypothetical protein